MKKLYLALSLLVVAAGVASHFRDLGRQWLATLMDPREHEPVPLLRVTPQDYRVLVRADGELTGLQITPVHAPMVKTGSLKVAWLADDDHRRVRFAGGRGLGNRGTGLWNLSRTEGFPRLSHRSPALRVGAPTIQVRKWQRQDEIKLPRS